MPAAWSYGARASAATRASADQLSGFWSTSGDPTGVPSRFQLRASGVRRVDEERRRGLCSRQAQRACRSANRAFRTAAPTATANSSTNSISNRGPNRSPDNTQPVCRRRARVAPTVLAAPGQLLGRGSQDALPTPPPTSAPTSTPSALPTVLPTLSPRSQAPRAGSPALLPHRADVRTDVYTIGGDAGSRRFPWCRPCPPRRSPAGLPTRRRRPHRGLHHRRLPRLLADSSAPVPTVPRPRPAATRPTAIDDADLGAHHAPHVGAHEPCHRRRPTLARYHAPHIGAHGAAIDDADLAEPTTPPTSEPTALPSTTPPPARVAARRRRSPRPCHRDETAVPTTPPPAEPPSTTPTAERRRRRRARPASPPTFSPVPAPRRVVVHDNASRRPRRRACPRRRRASATPTPTPAPSISPAPTTYASSPVAAWRTIR